MANGLGTQVDGNHYTNMKMQPIELAYRVYGTPCFCKLAKYLTREKGDKLTNLQKALHCIQLERDLKHCAVNYLNNVAISRNESLRLIGEFTEIELYRNALFFMWVGYYNEAEVHVRQIIEEYSI